MTRNKPLVLCPSRGRSRSVPQPHAHERKQLIGVHRLRDVVRRSRGDRLLAVALHRLRRQWFARSVSIPSLPFSANTTSRPFVSRTAVGPSTLRTSSSRSAPSCP